MKAIKYCFIVIICAAFLVCIPFTGGNTAVKVSAAPEENRDYGVYLIEYNDGTIVYVAEGKINGSSTLTQIIEFENNHLKDTFEKDLKNQTIPGVDGETVKFDYKVDYLIGEDKENDCDVLVITFHNYYSFAMFNNINLSASPRAYQDIKKSLFFHERTLDFGDPYSRFFLQAPETAGIVNDFYQILNGKAYNDDLHYIFASDFRRTEVNSEDVYSSFGFYEYYFKLSSTYANSVIVFDRFANTPIWYGIAVAATLVFMIPMYLIFKKHHKNKQRSDELTQNNTMVIN